MIRGSVNLLLVKIKK